MYSIKNWLIAHTLGLYITAKIYLWQKVLWLPYGQNITIINLVKKLMFRFKRTKEKVKQVTRLCKELIFFTWFGVPLNNGINYFDIGHSNFCKHLWLCFLKVCKVIVF